MAEESSGSRAMPQQVGPPRRRMSRTMRARAVRNRRRRRTIGLLTLAVFGAIIVAIVLLAGRMFGSLSTPPEDYAGGGDGDALFQVHLGDTTEVIANSLVEQGVIAGVAPFMAAAKGNEEIRMIQPGFYLVRTRIPAATAVEQLADPANRVGKLTISEGRQLDDVLDLRNDKTTSGIFSLIAEASCYTLNGDEHCVSAEDLRAAAEDGTPVELRVPEWAVKPVTKMTGDHRRLEGLIAAGTWQFDPTAEPREILASLIDTSAAHYAQSGLLGAAETVDLTAYQVLTVASLLQKEAHPNDFAKVARVIYNRLEVPQMLQFDSTVNYPLDRQEIATTDADRAKKTPWNTYAMEGLPATPIGSPGVPALTASEHPATGDYLYFVTVDMDGTTLFTRDYRTHLANIEIARRNGVLDSAR